MKNVRIDHYQPGYDPTRDHIPPRQASLGPLVTCGVMLLFFAFVVGGIVSFLATRHKQEAAALATAESTPEATAEITVDAWGATGTALYLATLTPTATETPTPTPTETAAATFTATRTPDNWQATGTAIYVTLSGMWSPTPTFNSGPSSLAVQTAAAYKPKPTRSSSGLGVVGAQPIQPTQRPPSIVVITRESPPIVVTRYVQVVVTATPMAESTQEVQPSATLTTVATLTLISTVTSTYTATATSSPTETTTVTMTPTATNTDTPTATATATFTDVPTWTFTPTLTETPTNIPTEVQES